jgi:hypothetical protein
VWHLEPYLIERILPTLEREPRLRPIPQPDPVPDLRVFEQLIGEEPFAALNLTRHRGERTAVTRAGAGTEASPTPHAAVAIDPDVLADLRDPLVARLPRIPELEPLRLWPWWPWQPWWDCTPDIIFRVTQDCVAAGTVIVDEGYGDTRRHPDPARRHMVANDKAWPARRGRRSRVTALLTNVCDSPINIIGGNPGAAPAPVGYPSPGVISNPVTGPTAVACSSRAGGQRRGLRVQRSSDGGGTWNDMPGTAVGDIPRQYWIPASNTFQWVPFLDTVDGRLVLESRQHYEAMHDPGTWGVTRFWMAHNYLSLMNWLTQTPFLNGTYRLRIKGWQLVGGHLTNPQNLEFLPTCSIETPAELVLRIDNRLEGVASGHPLADPNHPCGSAPSTPARWSRTRTSRRAHRASPASHRRRDQRQAW